MDHKKMLEIAEKIKNNEATKEEKDEFFKGLDSSRRLAWRLKKHMRLDRNSYKKSYNIESYDACSQLDLPCNVATFLKERDSDH